MKEERESYILIMYVRGNSKLYSRLQIGKLNCILVVLSNGSQREGSCLQLGVLLGPSSRGGSNYSCGASSTIHIGDLYPYPVIYKTN